MRRVPLFPLNTVLYPRMPLRLHIFEERYKLMVQHCVEQEMPFGVVLIREGSEVGIPAEPHRVGCLARITQVQPVGMGRMNLIAVGDERFEILSLDDRDAYMSAEIETLPLFDVDKTQAVYLRLRGWLERYLTLIAKAENAQIDFGQLPADPLNFAYLTASLLKVPIEQKQALLQIDSALDLTRILYETTRKEVTLMNIVGEYNGGQEMPFSVN